jgi:hypothetical protein
MKTLALIRLAILFAFFLPQIECHVAAAQVSAAAPLIPSARPLGLAKFGRRLLLGLGCLLYELSISILRSQISSALLGEQRPKRGAQR